MPDHGISPDFNPSKSVAMILASFASIALYNVVELAFVIFATFKRKSGLYFWSFVAATTSIVPYTLGFIFKFFDIIRLRTVPLTMIALGWCGMITGQSVVLYSRLHLVVQDRRILRAVLVMIVVDALICHVPTLVLLYGANGSNPDPYLKPYSIYEKVQITIFFIQEVIISSLYIWATWTALKPGGNILGRNVRSAMKHLMLINAVIILLDLTLLGIEYSGFYEIQVMFKGALYSAKLKMEFRILNQLVSLTCRSSQEWSNEYSSEPRDTGILSLRTANGHESKDVAADLTTFGATERSCRQSIGLTPAESRNGRAMSDPVGRKTSYPDLDTDSDDEGRGSLDITSEATNGNIPTTASSRLGAPFVR